MPSLIQTIIARYGDKPTIDQIRQALHLANEVYCATHDLIPPGARVGEAAHDALVAEVQRTVSQAQKGLI